MELKLRDNYVKFLILILNVKNTNFSFKIAIKTNIKD